MNATDMTHGLRIGFNQDAFDVICSDLSRFPVARAAAASSAVPMLLSPITMRNYAGTCGFKIPEGFEEILKGRAISERQLFLANNIAPFLDSQKKPYIHLVDGGVADNLGLRAVLDRVTPQRERLGNDQRDSNGKRPQGRLYCCECRNAAGYQVGQIGGYSSPGCDDVGLLLDSDRAVQPRNHRSHQRKVLRSWADEIKAQRCKGEAVSTAPGSCGDIEFYVVEVKFDALKDEAERMHFKRLPTSFKMPAEEVDKLRDVAHRILVESEEFQRLLGDLR